MFDKNELCFNLSISMEAEPGQMYVVFKTSHPTNVSRSIGLRAIFKFTGKVNHCDF